VAFLAALPAGHLHAVEFRNPDWYAGDVYEALARHGVSLCVHDMRGSEAPRIAVGPFVYLRLHGANGRYGGRYPDADLVAWAEWLAARHEGGQALYVYFNNDVGGHAPRDAVRLRDRLAKLIRTPHEKQA
jgi:uncharacterized protein YecE (DUF72 family)